jgi:hypothetical protein
MRVASSFLSRALVTLLAAVIPSPPAWALVVDFENLAVPASGAFNGDPGTLAPGQSVSTPWTSGGVEFANTFGIDIFSGFTYEYWSGFAYSNVVDTTDPAFQNQYASYPGGGYESAVYAVAYSAAAAVTLPGPSTVAGFRIANTTYAALTMKNGDAYGFSAPLPAGGWFATTATGRLAGTVTGSTTFLLADLRGPAPAGILASWAWFDLSPLGAVDRIEFSFDGSDKGAFGLNTPAYFAMDDLTLTPVAEPASLMTTLAAAAGGLGLVRSRRRHA